MKAKQEVEFSVCDFCDGNAAFRVCSGCGRDICSECEDKKAVRYQHQAHNGYKRICYCNECVSRLSAGGTDKGFNAVLKLADIIKQSDDFYKPWEERRKSIEAEIEKFVKQ